ncbi:MAG: hypothetical protein LBC02_01940 [Planctomycetaceae bacterium]|jgi:hypothetical protein|nr:hypothetical protein [Planctomycetaceae bacterium]
MPVFSSPNWQWFGSLSLQEIKQFADKSPNINWLQKAIVWITDRNNGQGPPENYVPMLTTNINGGQLSFLTVDEKRTYGQLPSSTEFEVYAYNAAKLIFDLFKPFNHSLGNPSVDIYCDECDGSSLSLPVIIAALQRLTGILLPDTVVSTGCLTNGELTPVDSDTLSLKIEAAKQFGYKTLLVVAGQTGIPNPNPCAMKIIKINPNPLSALFDIIKLAINKNETEEGLALLLAAYSNRNIRDKLCNVEEITAPFANSNSNLVRHVANDLRSRSALHNGETEKSAKYRELAGTLAWNEIPTNNLGHYLRYEQIASCSVLAVDTGIWNDNYYAHQEVDNRLEHLLQAIKGKFADADDYLSALTMLNTRALRQRFFARLNYVHDHDLSVKCLQSAWKDLTTLYEEWDNIWAYAKKIDRRDTNFERQRNYCLECLADYKRIVVTDSLSNLLKAKEFLMSLNYENFTINDGFDVTAKIQYYKLTDKSFCDNDVERAITQSQIYFDNRPEYPNYLPYELLLRYGYVSGNQEQICVEQLRQAYNESLKLPSTSIETLLALRIRQILIDHGAKPILPLTAPPAGTRLREIYDNLISTPEMLVDRCPY